jgi:hypothetical protein
MNSRRPVGYIGRNGFCAEEPPPEEQFLVDSRVFDTPSRDMDVRIKDPRQITDPGQTYLLTDDGLVSINLRDRSVKSLLADATILSCARYFDDFILRMPDRMLAITRDGKEHESFPLPAELRNVGFDYFPTKEHVAVVLRKERHVNDLFWIDHDGKITRQEHVALRNDSRRAEAENNLVNSVTWLCPALPLGAAAYGCWNAYKIWKHENHATPSDEPQGHFARLREDLEDYLMLLVIPSVASAILALIAYRRQRKFGLPSTGLWVVFVLLFGLPGFFGYLAHRVWPARLPCPKCGKLVSRDRPACFACGQEFPEPAMKGTEVFA